MLYTYVSITYSYFQGILYSFYFINCMEVTVHTPLSREVFWHEYVKSRTYKPKFHCRRQSGMNFGYVTVNGVNSNVWELFYSLCVPLTTLIPRSSIILQICVILGHSCFPSGRRQTPTWMVLIFSLTSLSIFSRIPLSSMGSIGLAPLHPLQVIIAARQVSSG